MLQIDPTTPITKAWSAVGRRWRRFRGTDVEILIDATPDDVTVSDGGDGETIHVQFRMRCVNHLPTTFTARSVRLLIREPRRFRRDRTLQVIALLERVPMLVVPDATTLERFTRFTVNPESESREYRFECQSWIRGKVPSVIDIALAYEIIGPRRHVQKRVARWHRPPAPPSIPRTADSPT